MGTIPALQSTALRLAANNPVDQARLDGSLSAAWTNGKAIAALPYEKPGSCRTPSSRHATLSMSSERSNVRLWDHWPVASDARLNSSGL